MELFNRSMLPRDASEARQFALDKGLIVTNRVCNRHHRDTPTIRDSDNGFFGMYQCRKCNGRKKSLADGTWFENARLEPRKIFDVMYSWCKEDTYEQVRVETARLDDPTVLSQPTIAFWYACCRDVAVDIMAKEQAAEGQLGGEGVTVQIDESKFGVRKFHKGRRVEGHWVLGITESKLGEEDKDGKFRMIVLPHNKRDRATLESVIVQHVAPGTTIWTDGWRGYFGLEGHGFIHESVNHSDISGFNWVSEEGVHTQRVESMWRRPKDDFRAKHPKKDEDSFAVFLCEYLWRRHCRQRKQDTFLSLLAGVAEFWQPPASF